MNLPRYFPLPPKTHFSKFLSEDPLGLLLRIHLANLITAWYQNFDSICIISFQMSFLFQSHDFKQGENCTLSVLEVLFSFKASIDLKKNNRIWIAGSGLDEYDRAWVVTWIHPRKVGSKFPSKNVGLKMPNLDGDLRTWFYIRTESIFRALRQFYQRNHSTEWSSEVEAR